jgi:hypothetical protein
MSQRSERIDEAIQSILQRFENGTIGEVIAQSMTPRHPDDVRPSDKWSFSNRILMGVQHTSDARGYRQWQAANRHVKKGAKAVYILAPWMRKTTDEETGEEQKVLRGFGTVAVFRYEDTEGEPLPVFHYEPPAPPPLQAAAAAFDIPVTYGAAPGASYLGFYHRTEKRIHLLTHDHRTFWHELGHAAHHRVLEARGVAIEGCPQEMRETVAEVSACVLASFYGEDMTGTAYRYVRSCAASSSPTVAVMRVLEDIGDTVQLILGTDAAN